MKHNDSHDRIEIPAHVSAKHHWRPRHPEIFSNAQVSRQTGDYQSAVTASIAH